MNLDAVIRRSQVAVEAMIDIAYHLCAKKLSLGPRECRASQLLAKHNIIPADFLPKALTMVRFRNKVVHGYLDENAKVIAAILETNLPDFAEWENIVADALASVRGAQAEQPE